MGENVLDRDGLLPVLRELRPVVSDGPRDVELISLGEKLHHERRDSLGDRERENERVLGPGTVWGGVAAPDVNDLLTSDVRAERSADVAAGAEVFVERVA